MDMFMPLVSIGGASRIPLVTKFRSLFNSLLYLAFNGFITSLLRTIFVNSYNGLLSFFVLLMTPSRLASLFYDMRGMGLRMM